MTLPQPPTPAATPDRKQVADWTAEEAVTALLALCGAYDEKPPAWRSVPTWLIREAITGERA